MEKRIYIKIRISITKKLHWKKSAKKGHTITDLITASVENRILDGERRQILACSLKTRQHFVKIETNINQIARIVNGQKFISENELNDFSSKMKTIIKLKEQQNEIFVKSILLIADDR